MATQEYIDDLIIVIETAEDAESVTNQMVAAVLDHLNVNLKKVSESKEIQAEEASRIAADAALQKAIDAVSLRIDRLVGNNASQAIDNFNEILNFLNGLKDSDSLAALLADINARIGREDGSQSEDGSVWGELKSLSQDISSCSEDISTLQIDRDGMKLELALATGRIDEKVEQAVNEKTSKPLTISPSEHKAGVYNMGGDKIDIYERSVRLQELPRISGVTKEYVIADEPLGFGIYANIDSFVISSGKGVNREFFNFSYEITRYYINAQLQSCVAVRCKDDVSEEVSGLLHVQYCKFFGDVVEFDIVLPGSVDKSAVSLEIPPLKFNKKMAFSYITDDSYAIYQYI